MKNKMDKPEIGMLWINKYHEGKISCISGVINGEKVMILLNKIKFKQAKGAPDFTVFSCDREAVHDEEENEYSDESNVDVSEEEFDF